MRKLRSLVGSDRQLSREVPQAVPAINECPEASPCFCVHHLCAVTVGKDLETPQCSNSLSSSSPAAIQSPGPLCIPARFSLRGRKIVVYLKTSPLSDFFDKRKKKSSISKQMLFRLQVQIFCKVQESLAI